MLILKGVNGKGKVLNDLMAEHSCLCYSYGDDLMLSTADLFFYKKDGCTLNDLKDCIKHEMEDHPYEWFVDYFVIYTNEWEDDLYEFLEWLDCNELNWCRQVIVTCK